jgi:DNA-binding NarL/FixJ family response regulator
MSNGVIINSATGEIIQPDRKKHESILSSREKEVLQLIERGKTSEEIADLLFISKYTVSRHRQNILEKLRVKNSIEAIRIAKYAFVID